MVSRRDFCDFVVNFGLLDLGFIGYPYTWRSHLDEGPIQQRLDRGLAPDLWIVEYLEAKVRHEVWRARIMPCFS